MEILVGGSRKTFLIHGLAAFIVVSYTRVALLSMNFLISAPLHHNHKHVEDRSFLVGTIKYFSIEHSPYILFAFLFLLISIVVPVYLILTPLCKKLCPTQDEQDDKCDPPLCCCAEKAKRGKFKEFLREFYGPFKNDCQFYAGFFFLYRLAFYATFAFTPTPQIQFCVQQFLLVTMLLIHSVLQPYDTEYSNRLDALIFFNLNCINALAVYNFFSVIDIQGEPSTAIAFQLFFTYLPLLYVLYRFVLWFREACCTENRLDNDDDNDDERRPIIGRNNTSRTYTHNERMEMIGQRQKNDPEGARQELTEEFQQHTINEDHYDFIDTSTH